MSATPVLVIHGGAGTISRAVFTPDKLLEYSQALRSVLLAGYSALLRGESALESAVRAVSAFEDCPLFNAGRGSVYTRQGTHEMDASLMDGASRAAGAVASVTNVKNPIQAARAVMEHSPHVLMVGQGAEAFLRERGIAFAPDEYFHTDFRLAQLKAVQAQAANQVSLDHDADPRQGPPAGTDKMAFSGGTGKMGTVGAVALDKKGRLAAATSTGGMTNKLPGRVGDSPIIGAGCYADDLTAISCTGTGEAFMRLCLARDLSLRMRYLGEDLEQAGQACLEALGELGGTGGFIALDRQGRAILPFNTEGMYRGLARSADDLQVAVHKENRALA
ncbi:MAG: isoaspartyl peptidase/L-asparaginase [Deltaproteobacteria bacterium]|nr:isoaspartyl peptidase/L-asparaginase [Deltaproteobacteria bacterium]